MAKDIPGKYMMLDGKMVENANMEPFHPGVRTVYEVVRVINGISLFLEDHLGRFRKSLAMASLQYAFNEEDITRNIMQVIKFNKLENGNIRFYYTLPEPAGLNVLIVPHAYPSPAAYLEGVKAMVFQGEREHPHVKSWKPELKAQIDQLLRTHDVYELLLCNKNNCLTEGSRSNLFFVKDNKIYTAPSKLILEGVTRKYILSIINQLHIPLLEECVLANEIDQQEAAFLTGTSPKVLPIKTIDQTNLDVAQPLVKEIARRYDQLITSYITKKKFHET